MYTGRLLNRDVRGGAFDSGAKILSYVHMLKTASQMHVAPRIFVHSFVPRRALDDAPEMPQMMPQTCPRHSSDMPQVMPQLMPQIYLSVSYLISSKSLLFENITHNGLFSTVPGCNGLFMTVPSSTWLHLALLWYVHRLPVLLYIYTHTGLNAQKL